MYTSKSTTLDFQTMHEASKDLKFVWKCFSAGHYMKPVEFFKFPLVQLLTFCLPAFFGILDYPYIMLLCCTCHEYFFGKIFLDSLAYAKILNVQKHNSYYYVHY